MWSALLFAMAMPPATQADRSGGGVLTVQELKRDHVEHDGERVRVTGWLGPCGPKACRLFDTSQMEGAAVSIAKSVTFDRRAARLRSRRVTVEAVVRSRCFEAQLQHLDDGGTILVANCVGRDGQLVSPRLVDAQN